MTTDVVLYNKELCFFNGDNNNYYYIPINPFKYGAENQMYLNKECYVTKSILSVFFTSKPKVNLYFHKTNENVKIIAMGPFYKRYYCCRIENVDYEVHFFRNGNMGIYIGNNLISYTIKYTESFNNKIVQKIICDDDVVILHIYAINMALNIRFNGLHYYKWKTYPILETRKFDQRWKPKVLKRNLYSF